MNIFEFSATLSDDHVAFLLLILCVTIPALGATLGRLYYWREQAKAFGYKDGEY